MSSKPLEPIDYQRVFEGDPVGVRILEDLVSRYGTNPYVKGGLEAQRETDFRAGRLEVVNFILRKINQANGAHDDGHEPE
ncbi:hypothetical protein [Lysobacter sp. ESA13C]|uniref:Bbp19 family protein n=1 Tax=Lysobacter sp. ESA13C TaxID=2862676 RepID=UPI001CBDE234|nr:hypothetical protein [Lysobacter sp. ESA13C]